MNAGFVESAPQDFVFDIVEAHIPPRNTVPPGDESKRNLPDAVVRSTKVSGEGRRERIVVDDRLP